MNTNHSEKINHRFSAPDGSAKEGGRPPVPGKGPAHNPTLSGMGKGSGKEPQNSKAGKGPAINNGY